MLTLPNGSSLKLVSKIHFLADFHRLGLRPQQLSPTNTGPAERLLHLSSRKTDSSRPASRDLQERWECRAGALSIDCARLEGWECSSEQRY